MDFLITKRVPCSVCGVVSFRHEGWFLLVENRWLEHLKTLVAHWLDQSSPRLLLRADALPLPITSDPTLTDLDLDPPLRRPFARRIVSSSGELLPRLDRLARSPGMHPGGDYSQ